MREDDLHRQIAELVADHADQAPPRPIAAIRRRGRLRRARLASGAVLLIGVAAGLVAVQGPLDRRTTPAPVVTQPPRPIQPGAGFADYVRDRFDDLLVDMTVVTLASGKAGGDDWQLAAVRGTSRRSQEDKVCLVHKTDGRSHGYGYSCRDEASNRVMDRMTFGGGGTEQPQWAWRPRGQSGSACRGRGRPRPRFPRWRSALASGDATTSPPRPRASEPCWPWMRRDTRSPASPRFHDNLSLLRSPLSVQPPGLTTTASALLSRSESCRAFVTA